MRDDTKAAAHQSLNCIKNKNNIKYGKKQFSIWRMEFLHPAMWHDHDIDCAMWLQCTLQCGMWLWNHHSEFTQWQHPAMWYVFLGWHAVEFARWQHPAMWHVALESWHWIRQVAAPCNVAGGSGMTCHWICPNVCHIYTWFWFRQHHRRRHVILHLSPKLYPNQTSLSRKNDVMYQDGWSEPSWILGIQ